MKLEEHPDYIVNPDDLVINFWGHTYIVYVTAQGISFLVNAANEGEALDYVMDHIVDLGLVGLYTEDYNEEYPSAGNCMYNFTTYNIYVEEL